MIPETLITYIETAIIPRYKEFDKAHNLSHVRTVIEESLALARQYPEADERLAYVIAAYHDTGLCRDRATHHLVSGEILMADSTLRQWFSDTEILLMKEAVEDHRASTDHEPRSIYGKIVAEAAYHRPGHHPAPHRAVRIETESCRRQGVALPAVPSASHGKICTRRLSEALVSRGEECGTAEEAPSHYRRRRTAAASFQPNIRGGKVIAVSMKHMPHFISDYGNGLFPIMEQSVLYKETKCFL